jgi:hypothetical protein
MDMESYAYIAHLTTLVKEGKVKEATLWCCKKDFENKIWITLTTHLYCDENYEKKH